MAWPTPYVKFKLRLNILNRLAILKLKANKNGVGQVIRRVAFFIVCRYKLRRDWGLLTTQLFDLANDPQELHDVSAMHPEIVKQMESIMKKEHHTPELSEFLMPALEENNK